MEKNSVLPIIIAIYNKYVGANVSVGGYVSVGECVGAGWCKCGGIR
ncbi:MAG: hypothetical protein KBS96_05355 [Lachnospiraceae bacterium]|nr:hypothetical protein [Candidatus Colinaster scatohippi]